ncbi:YeiH family protein [Cytobacillus sp. IB215665]|uniref:YeiH family protein n=1 Tax=Cytobacillus sp. IB215665 TaxID=3097357 RepID=UPI002A16E2A0|nr:putative sulfate exporter family transporter [Cytobacillus sp. IB215665]MDX8364548.1 putative sulfate exporter family transporter [Cytobacillus sp. IB215665]
MTLLQENQPQIHRKSRIKENNRPFLIGVFLTFILATVAKFLATLPYLEMVGALVIALILGMMWRLVLGVEQDYSYGIEFSSKKLLRLGIILLGIRLNIKSIIEIGTNVLTGLITIVVITIIVIMVISKRVNVDNNIGLLTACGTGICGAAAIVAIAPQMRAKNDQITISIAVIALLGTLFTLIFVLISAKLPLSDIQYGILSGLSLHELAHVVAAADVRGKSATDIAVIIKLTRVLLLVPIAIIIGHMYRMTNNNSAGNRLPFPWFIIGFLSMSILNTFIRIPVQISDFLVVVAYILIGTAMAALGLMINTQSFRLYGIKAFIAGLVGTIFMVTIAYVFVTISSM